MSKRARKRANAQRHLHASGQPTRVQLRLQLRRGRAHQQLAQPTLILLALRLCPLHGGRLLQLCGRGHGGAHDTPLCRRCICRRLCRRRRCGCRCSAAVAARLALPLALYQPLCWVRLLRPRCRADGHRRLLLFRSPLCCCGPLLRPLLRACSCLCRPRCLRRRCRRLGCIGRKRGGALLQQRGDEGQHRSAALAPKVLALQAAGPRSSTTGAPGERSAVAPRQPREGRPAPKPYTQQPGSQAGPTSHPAPAPAPPQPRPPPSSSSAAPGCRIAW